MSIINYKGYGLLKKTLTPDKEKELISELTVRPNINPNYDFGLSEPYPVYRVNSERYYVPKFYGIKHYGPINKEAVKERCGLDLNKDICHFNGQLRQDQIGFVSELMVEIQKNGSCIANAAAGAGKTTMSLYIVSKLKKKTLIIVHKQFLLDQWSERIKQYLPHIKKVGLIQQDIIDVDNCDIVIGMLQSISKKDYPSTLFDQFGLVIIDEVHHICSNVFSRTLFKVASRYMLGLSATVKRADGLDKVLHWFLGPTLVKTALDITLERPQVKFISASYASDIKLKYNFKQKIIIPDLITKITMDPVRNKQIVDEIDTIIKNNLDRKILFLSDRREHCFIIKEMLSNIPDFKKTIGLYIGLMKQEELNESMKCDIMLGTYQLISEGFDRPDLDTIILGSSKSSIVQSVGRVMRRKNKNPPLIIDITDKKYMIGQYKTRLKVYTEKNYIISYDGIEEDVSEKEDISEKIKVDKSMFRDD